jgi:raffinose/stachyose/melibiose transport system permease protein
MMHKQLSRKGLKFNRVVSTAITNLGAIFWACVAVFPLYLIVITSLKEQGRMVVDPLGLPKIWHWENISLAWQKGHFATYFQNSVVVTVSTVGIVLILSFFTAYAFARMSFPGKNLIYVIFLVGLAIPGDVLLIPLYYILKDMDLLNKLWALILPGAAFGLSFAILMLRSFIEQLPKEILEAAIIDGCSELQVALKIVVPLCRPALLSLLILNFMWNWNSFIFPVVLIQTDELRTITAGLNYFQGRWVANVPLLMAGTLIIALPVIVVYILFQREFVKGITAGAVK